MRGPLHRGIRPLLRRALCWLAGLSLLAALLDFAVFWGIRLFLLLLRQNTPSEGGIDYGGRNLALWVFAMLLLLVIRAGVAFVRQSKMEKLWVGFESRWHAALARRLHSMHPSVFHTRERGRLVEEGIQAVRSLVQAGEALQQSLQGLFQLAIFLPVLFVLSPGLTLGLLLVVLPGLAWLQKKILQLGKPLQERLRERAAGVRLLQEWAEIVGNWTIRGDLARARGLLAGWRERSEGKARALAGQRALLVQSSEALSALGTVAVFGLSGWLLLQGSLDEAELILYCAALFLCYKPLKECARLAPVLREAGIAQDFLQELGQLPGKNPKTAEPAPNSGEQFYNSPRLFVHNLSFAYANTPEVPVFANWKLPGPISGLELHKPILLRGKNGAGKTTLLRLLAGLEIPLTGSIAWRGLPTNEIAFMAYPPPLPFDPGELRTRLLAGSPAFQDLVETLGGAQLVNLLNRDLGTGPFTAAWSAGQRQRLALAWLTGSSCRIFLLDEPVASLPLDKRQPVLQALARWAKQENRILLVASHEEVPKDWQMVDLCGD